MRRPIKWLKAVDRRVVATMPAPTMTNAEIHATSFGLKDFAWTSPYMDPMIRAARVTTPARIPITQPLSGYRRGTVPTSRYSRTSGASRAGTLVDAGAKERGCRSGPRWLIG